MNCPVRWHQNCEVRLGALMQYQKKKKLKKRYLKDATLSAAALNHLCLVQINIAPAIYSCCFSNLAI